MPVFIENISGWTQDEGQNGTTALHEKLLAALDDYSGLSVRIRSRRWNENWRAIALNYHALRLIYPKPEPFIIIVNAYSYGVGHGLTWLAKQLGRYNLEIEVANLCDGVYCHWLPIGWWRAMVGGFRIKLPENVKAYHGFYQRKNRPRGYEPIGSYQLTWTQMFVEHQWMDDETEWHNHCIEVCTSQVNKWVGGPKSLPQGSPVTLATESRLSNDTLT